MEQILNFIQTNFLGILKLTFSQPLGAITINVKKKILEKENKEEDEILLAYYPLDKLELGKDLVQEKIKELDEKKTITVENKLLYNMPSFEYKLIDKATHIYILISYNDKIKLLVGFPQPITVEGINYIQYVLVTEPEELGEETGGWMIAPTSIGSKFLKYCKENFDIKNFRNDRDFSNIIITGSVEDPPKYYDRIIKYKKINMNNFINNDKYGNPKLYGGFALDTWRYINNLIEIDENFNPKQTYFDFKIIEIGGGYGGLCAILKKYYNCKYFIIELPEVLEITKQYLSKLEIENVKYYSTEQMGEINDDYDLVISEYSLTELSDQMVDQYLDKICSRANNAYIVANIWDYMRKKQFISKLKKLYEIVEEKRVFPKGKYPNYILFCYEKRSTSRGKKVLI